MPLSQEYVLRVDPVTNLGLSAESVYSYHLGEITRTKGEKSVVSYAFGFVFLPGGVLATL